MYRKMPIIPAKITIRYSRISPTRSAGVRSARIIQSMPAKITIFRTSVTVPKRTKEASIPSFRPRESFCPKRMEKTVPLPIANPSKIEVRKVMSEKAEPTAARASAPRNRPTISVSAIL